MILNQNDTVFFIIDVQEKLANAVFNKQELLKKSEILAKASDILQIPVVVTEQYPQGLGETVPEIKAHLSVDTKYFEKKDFNALADEKVLETLKSYGKNQVVIWGIETHICVHQTVASLLANGFQVTLVADSCGSRSEVEYNSAIKYMQNNGVSIKTTEMILFELLKSAKHPNFKEVQTLIK